jgi:hypothetical protein
MSLDPDLAPEAVLGPHRTAIDERFAFVSVVADQFVALRGAGGLPNVRPAMSTAARVSS